MTEKLSDELLHILRSSQSKAQSAQLNYQAILQEIAELYQLTEGDNVDVRTGVITRKGTESLTGQEISENAHSAHG